MKYKILIIDDEESVCYSIKRILSKDEDSIVDTAHTGKDGIELFKKNNYDIVITDLILGEINGLEVIKEIKKIEKEAILILITGKGTEKVAADAIKEGAFDYFSKPFNYTEFFKTVRNAKEHIRLRKEKYNLENAIKSDTKFYNLSYKSEEMNNLVNIIKKVSKTDSSVLITGASGTGKELIAESIHLDSKRASGPFIKLNCGALPKDLIESELFGYEKGAFTGAVSSKKGKLELADGGSIFLDEIGEMDLQSQVKLLRVLEDGVLCKIGSNNNKKIDIRFIAATNVNLEEAIENKEFRLDLYYRLNVFKLEVKSLKNRKSDIIYLAEKFLKDYSEKFEFEYKSLSDEFKRSILSYHWPGNVRELKNVVQNVVVFSQDEEYKVEDLPDYFISNINKNKNSDNAVIDFDKISLKEFLKTQEKKYIKSMIEKYGDNKSNLAKKMDISRKSLYEKLKEYELM